MKRYAIIGCGALGKWHLSSLLRLEASGADIRLAAIMGASPDSLTKKTTINIGEIDLSAYDFSNCHFYDDFRELIDREKPDFVISALPTFLHSELAIYALERGIDVFSEKPMALTLEECDAMIRAKNESGAVLMIGQCLRFDPVFRKIKEYIDTGVFGKLYRAEFSRYSKLPGWTFNNWILDPKLSGGCVFDMHIHDVDLINWLFGKPIRINAVMTEKRAERESIFAQYIYDGLLVTSAADWSMHESYPFEARSQFNFENASVVVRGSELTVYTNSGEIRPELPALDIYNEEIKAFLLATEKRCPPEEATPESVRESIALALSEIAAAHS